MTAIHISYIFTISLYSKYDNWTIKKAEHQRIDAFEQWCWRRLLRVPWPVNLKGDQPWIFTGKTDAEAEAPVFWSSDANRWLIGKVPDAGQDWGQKKRASEDEMAGWHYWCNGHELGQTPETVRDRDRQCCHLLLLSRFSPVQLCATP